MSVIIAIDQATNPVPIFIVGKKDAPNFIQSRSLAAQNWLAASGFKPVAGSTGLIPDEKGALQAVVFVTGQEFDPSFYARLAAALSAGDYKLDTELSPQDAHHLALGWILQSYAFTRYKTKTDNPSASKARLVCPGNVDQSALQNEANAIFLTRNLINTPANDMTPATLADQIKKVADSFNANCKIIVGDDLLTENYPAVFTVGKASTVAPRLIDFTWGDNAAPKVTLVGKGVCFDTGGLDIKDAGGMLTMKKDMGGAATVLGLAQLIMAQNLKVRLRVIIPAVENAIAGNAMRPLDIMKTRKGLTVEIGNTDAEGRLILADALFEASREKPELLIDFATLTGAARVALGPELPAIFCQQEDLTAEFLDAARNVCDPIWPLPLWQGYRKDLESRTADLNNIAAGGFAGAIYAGLFLQEFVEPDTNWIHIDTYAWNNKPRPGRPEGGEALALRAAYNLIKRRYA